VDSVSPQPKKIKEIEPNWAPSTRLPLGLLDRANLRLRRRKHRSGRVPLFTSACDKGSGIRSDVKEMWMSLPTWPSTHRIRSETLHTCNARSEAAVHVFMASDHAGRTHTHELLHAWVTNGWTRPNANLVDVVDKALVLTVLEQSLLGKVLQEEHIICIVYGKQITRYGPSVAYSSSWPFRWIWIRICSCDSTAALWETCA
jgi:hypothetical protein